MYAFHPVRHERFQIIDDYFNFILQLFQDFFNTAATHYITVVKHRGFLQASGSIGLF